MQLVVAAIPLSTLL